MRILLLFWLACLTFLFACKTDRADLPVPEKKISYKDSVSFEISGTKYVFDFRYSGGSGNRQINIKPYSSEIPGRRSAMSTGGYYFYGPADSTLYEAHYAFNSHSNPGGIKFLFTKQYRNDQLRKDLHLMVPPDNSDLFKVGKQSFNVDYDKENTTDGVALEVSIRESSSLLTTYIPGFSIIIRSDLKKDLQDNSIFEIKKVEPLDNGRFLIEAKFEVNLFDEEGKPYRVKNGFMRLVTDMRVYGTFK